MQTSKNADLMDEHPKLIQPKKPEREKILRYIFKPEKPPTLEGADLVFHGRNTE